MTIAVTGHDRFGRHRPRRSSLVGSALRFGIFASLLATSVAAMPTGDTSNWGFDLAGRDTGQEPGDSFYGYANGGWLKNTPIRPGSFRAGSTDDLDQAALIATRTLVEAAANDAGNTSKVALVYRAYADRAAVEKRGIEPIRPLLATISGAASKDALVRQMGASFASFGASPFRFSIDADAKDTSRYVIGLVVSPLGLPGNSYYSDAKLAPTKGVYRSYIAHMLEMADWPQADHAADLVVAFETELAQASAQTSPSRDPVRAYNPYSVDQLATLAPGFPWNMFLSGAGLHPAGNMIVEDPARLKAAAAVYATTPLETLKAWSAFKTVDHAAEFLPERFVSASDRFHLIAVQGWSEPPPQWQAALEAVNYTLVDDVSQLYLATYLPAETSAATKVMGENMRQAFAARIGTLAWMSDATKVEAQKKLAGMKIEIGSPGVFADYAPLDIVPGDLFGNAARGRGFEWHRKVARLGRPVNRNRWQIPPQYVGASYAPELNLVAVPAAYLRPPMFDRKADPAINYGALGATIGHEMTHGFDDQGRRYDAKGNLRDWWAPHDAAYFDAEGRKLAAQYSLNEPLPGLHVDGAASVGESMADLGGLLIAIDAYHLSLNGKPAPVINGYTGDQRVFLAFAQMWREKLTESYERSTLLTNPHSPADVRVHETIRNIDSWYTAFGVKRSERLYRQAPERIRIW